MNQYAFYYNADKCIYCRVCALACKDKHNHKPGRKFRRVYSNCAGSWDTSGSTPSPDGVYSYSFTIACNHCADPACMKVCPANAIAKRADGIVFIDRELCIGCESCSAACPYNAPSFDREAMKMEKCDFCRELLAEGETPACAASCNMQAIEYGELEMLKVLHPEAVQQIFPLPDPSQTRPSLLITPHRKYKADQETSVFNMPEELQAYET